MVLFMCSVKCEPTDVCVPMQRDLFQTVLSANVSYAAGCEIALQCFRQVVALCTRELLVSSIPVLYKS